MTTAATTDRDIMLTAALEHLRFGWSVVPLHSPVPGGGCTCGRDCSNPGKHPRVAWKDYQTRKPTEEEVRSWWEKWPDANLAVVTGAVSGVVVVDLDGQKAVEYAKERGIPDTPVARTGRGYHVYFRRPELEIATKARLIEFPDKSCIDVRGDGGTAVLPPSLHPSGTRYAWTEGRSYRDVPLAPLPSWVLDLLEKAKAGAQGGDGESRSKVDPLAVLAGVPEGQRDVALFHYACRLRAQGLTRKEAESLVLEAARNCRPPFPEREALKKIDQAWKYPPGRALGAASGGGALPRLPGRVAVPEGWDKQMAVVTTDWEVARQAYASGKAVVVVYPDLTAPRGAGDVLRRAGEIEVMGEGEEKRRIEWALFPFLAMAGRAGEREWPGGPERGAVDEAGGAVQGAAGTAEEAAVGAGGGSPEVPGQGGQTAAAGTIVEAAGTAEEAAAGQVHSPEWMDELAALRAGRLLLFRNCRALGGRDFYLALDQRAAAKAPRGAGEPPVLTLAEALALARRNLPVHGEELYEVMSRIGRDVLD